MTHEICRHEPCGCTVSGQAFCSGYCEERTLLESATGSIPEDGCQCGHAACAPEAG